MVQDLLNFMFLFPIHQYGDWWWRSLFMICFQKGNVEDVVHLHCLGQLKLIGLAPNFAHDLERTNVSRQEFLCQVAFLDVQFLVLRSTLWPTSNV